MYTYMPEALLKPYQEVLKGLTEWDRSKQPLIWQEQRIDGEMMYKIHRHSARIVEETGLSVQQMIYDNYKEIDKIFPFYYQIIKIDNYFENAKVDEDVFCQSITYLNGEYENNTFLILNGETVLKQFDKTVYAFVIIWKKELNPDTPKWFIRPYHRLFM